ncbi:MAG: DUF2085 domain-containing protein [Pyrinomonadaceae bacterium]
MADAAYHSTRFVLDDTPEATLARPLIVWLAVAAATIVCVGLIFLAPLATSHGHQFIGLALYRGFSFACHQIPARSFYVEGYSLAVCARCAGLYIGFTAGVLLYPFIRGLKRTVAPPPRVWLIAAMMPLAFDWTLGFFGIWPNTHLSRFATGALPGTVAAFYALPGLLELSHTSLRGLFTQSILSKESVNYER